MKSWQSDIVNACAEWSSTLRAAVAGTLDYATRPRYTSVPSEPKVERLLRDRAVSALPTSDQPKVSVIIPVYGKYATTYWCLDSLARTRCSTPYEVIVVDDCSPDATLQMLGTLEGVRVVRNTENLGFVRSCNAGADVARGEFLCFLNNDTRVTDGWLDALLGTFDDFPKAGMAGGMLMFPDGVLQEAGGTVFRDGNCSHYGRNRDPQRPEFNYARPVDYCSGACLALRASLFHQLGGFDLVYVPAYYEDTDLAFKVRAQGLEVIYQPACKVVHYEGVTHGRNPTIGLKRHQTLNRAKFVQRWAQELKAHPAAGNRTWSAGERRLSRGVLVLMANGYPDFGTELGSVVLDLRAKGHRVSLCSPTNMNDLAALWQARGVEVLPGHGFSRTVARLRGSWSARYNHIAYVGRINLQMARRVRRSAPHLKQWQLAPSGDPDGDQNTVALDGVLTRADDLAD